MSGMHRTGVNSPQPPPPVHSHPRGAIPPGARWAWTLSYAGRLTGAAFKAFSVLAYMAMKGRCYPSHATLAERSGLSPGGVRKAIADLEQVGAISVSGSGGRRPDGTGIPCVYRLNLPQDGQVNLPQDGGEPAPEVGVTCPGTGGYLSQAGQQKKSKEEGKNLKGHDAPVGAGVSFSQQGMHDLAESLTVRADGQATERQNEMVARLAKKRHASLRYVQHHVIVRSVVLYDRRTCEQAWADCDAYPPEGTEADRQYAWRFSGRKGESRGWDRYEPRPKRTESMSSAEASAWIKALQGEAQP